MRCRSRSLNLAAARDLKLTGKDKTGKSESILAEFTLVTYVLRNK